MKKLIFFVGILLLVSCNSKTKKQNVNDILVAEAIGEYHLLDMDMFVDTIIYIPLETTDSILLGEIQQLIVENNKIIVTDGNSCKVFGINGSYLYDIGKRGEGPEEFLLVRSLDFFSSEDKLLIDVYPNKYLLFDFLQKNISTLKRPVIEDEYVFGETVFLSSDYFLSDRLSYTKISDKVLLWGSKSGETSDFLLFSNEQSYEKTLSSYSSFEVSKMFRYENKLRFYKELNDTIFSVDKDKSISPAYTFKLGKYKITPDLFLSRDHSKLPTKVWPLNLLESKEYLFIEFSFNNYAPEPFDFIQKYETGHEVTKTNTNVFSVFNKETGELKLMKQPIKRKQGFKNNIDEGLVFWPSYISSNDEMITFCNSYEFLEHFENVKDVPPHISELINRIEQDSNPIVIVAKLKEMQ